MHVPSQKGISLPAIIIIAGVFCIVIGGAFFLINNERAKARDAMRLSDMARVQAAFELLFSDTASYEGAAESGCNTKGMVVSQCNLGTYISSIAEIKDPGKYRYTVSEVPAADKYGVTFQLEKEYQDLSAGKHVLSPSGIR
ncbi:MAG: hypothetical protein PHY34_02960 [Patescibacteria group bacterium]|nr:hypothetical protein [Patescibacteria group bacterium]MDD5715419.1 hypothetical protein [Patescibacteria group bacterium]